MRVKLKNSNTVRVYLNVLYVVLNRTRVIFRKVSIQLINPWLGAQFINAMHQLGNTTNCWVVISAFTMRLLFPFFFLTFWREWRIEWIVNHARVFRNVAIVSILDCTLSTLIIIIGNNNYNNGPDHLLLTSKINNYVVINIDRY